MKEQNNRFAKLRPQHMKRIFAIENVVNIHYNVYEFKRLKMQTSIFSDADLLPLNFLNGT